jgi:hypothetical protein
MITLKDIPRHKAGIETSIQNVTTEAFSTERGKLASRAADLLGYKALVTDIAGISSFGVFSGKLTETLLKLEMDVLDTSVVIDYQMEEAGRRTKEAILENLNQWVAGWFSKASWEHTELSSYKRPVPEFVLDKAIRIKEALPEVKFYIQHLSDPKADPFLVAVVGDEIYYVDAWDEPRFEGRL